MPYVTLDGIRTHYEIHGSGPALLLLHGGGGCGENWAHAGRDQFARDAQASGLDVRMLAWRPNPGATSSPRVFDGSPAQRAWLEARESRLRVANHSQGRITMLNAS